MDVAVTTIGTLSLDPNAGPLILRFYNAANRQSVQTYTVDVLDVATGTASGRPWLAFDTVDPDGTRIRRFIPWSNLHSAEQKISGPTPGPLTRRAALGEDENVT